MIAMHAIKCVGLVSIATLVACSAAPSLQPQSPNVLPAAHARASSHGSWMDPNAKGQRLLYVSDPENDSVYVYGASSNKLVGTLPQIVNPNSARVDAQYKVWIVTQ